MARNLGCSVGTDKAWTHISSKMFVTACADVHYSAGVMNVQDSCLDALGFRPESNCNNLLWSSCCLALHVSDEALMMEKDNHHDLIFTFWVFVVLGIGTKVFSIGSCYNIMETIFQKTLLFFFVCWYMKKCREKKGRCPRKVISRQTHLKI